MNAADIEILSSLILRQLWMDLQLLVSRSISKPLLSRDTVTSQIPPSPSKLKAAASRTTVAAGTQWNRLVTLYSATGRHRRRSEFCSDLFGLSISLRIITDNFRNVLISFIMPESALTHKCIAIEKGHNKHIMKIASFYTRPTYKLILDF